MPLNSYEEAVEWITGRVAKGIRPGLKRMETMLERLGNPERRLKFIHVAGTNGKGSTCAYLTSVLLKSGYDVGTFTSPFIMKYTSRIQYNGESIGEDDLLRICRDLKPLVEDIEENTDLGAPTMFEVSTVLAIVYFATVTYPDYVVWETGLGGRLDSTNVVVPVISIITNIGRDHMDVLGDTIEQIAAEKAGIIKAGVPVVSAVEQPGAIEVLERVSREKKSSLYLAGSNYQIERVGSALNRQVFHFEGPFRRIENVAISMNGPHQFQNAGAALMAIEVLRQYYALIVDDDNLYAGMLATAWAGRLETIPGEPPILLDGAHNPEGAEALADSLRTVYSHNRLNVMMAMLSTKNHSDYLRHILPIVDTLIVTETDWVKKMEASKLAEIAESLRGELNPDFRLIVEPDWKKALELLKEITAPGDLAVVTGTLYMISDVRAWLVDQTESEKGW